jgi:GxxExxY protein
VILEVKAAEVLNPAHEAQLTNYLRATEVEVGLLLNFGQKARFVRKIFTNERKQLRQIDKNTDETD